MLRLGTIVSLDQLGYPPPTLRDAMQLAARINRDAGLNIIGMFNLVQSIATINGRLTGDLSARVRVQEWSLSQCISARRLRELRDKLGNASLLDQQLIHRTELLVALKLVAKYGDTTRGITFAERDDFDILSELALTINSLYAFQPTSARDLAATMGPFLELENPPLLDRALVRTAHMMGPALSRVAVSSPLARNVERIFLFMTGLNFDAFRDMTYAVFAKYAAIPVERFFAEQGLAHLNPYDQGNVMAASYLNRFLSRLAVDFGEVPGIVERAYAAPRFLFDFTGFRQYPIWRYGADNYMCVDPAFLLERLGAGFYWSIMNSLDSEERRREFSGVWGLLFQDYVLDLLRAMYPPASNVLVPEPYFERPNEEAFDALLDFGESIVAAEIKGPFVPIAAKYSGEAASFFGGVEEKFGDTDGGAVRQLATNLNAAFAYPPTRRICGFPDRQIREIFPVVIVQEPILSFGLVTKPLAEQLERLTAGKTWKSGARLWQLVILQVGDVETLLPFILAGDFRLVDMLRFKVNQDREHLQSFGEFFEQYRWDVGLATRQNPYLISRFERIRDESLARFEPASTSSTGRERAIRHSGEAPGEAPRAVPRAH